MLNISRRDLFKLAGVTGVATALGASPTNTFAQAVKAQAAKGAASKEDWHYSFCRNCMQGSCPNMYRIENGVVVELRGNPDAPSSKGAMCAKGNSVIQNLYNPYRVKKPMKRTNPKKGINEDPKWVEISWEEALATTSKVLKEVRENDPRRFIFQVGFGDFDYFGTYLFYFADAYGTPNYLKSNGELCAMHYSVNLVQGCFPTALTDFSRAKMVLALGVGGSFTLSLGGANGSARGLMDALEEGKRLVVIDPYCSINASKGEWVPIKPGTDLAFLMAFAHVILYEIKKMDTESLRWWTNSPYLIGPDGDYFRGADGKPQIYDASDKKVKSFDDKTLKTPELEIRNMAIGKIKVNSSFALVKDNLKSNTPEWAEKICLINAAKIRELAKDFVDNASLGETITLPASGGDKVYPLRTSSFICQRGVLNSRDGIHADLMAKIICMLVGSLDVPGGNIGCTRGAYWLSPDKDGVVAPKVEAEYRQPVWPPQHVNLYEFFPHKHTMPSFAYKVVADPRKYGLEYEIDALLTIGGNPIASTSEPEAIAASVAKIPFSATIAYHYDEMAHLSDILLPSHAMLERMSVNSTGFLNLIPRQDNMGLMMLMYRDPAPPIYDTRLPQDVIMDICERIGMIGDFNESVNKMGVMLGEVDVAMLDEEDQLALDKKYTYAEILDRGIKAFFGKQKVGIGVIARTDAAQSAGVAPAQTTMTDVGIETARKNGIIRNPNPLLGDFYNSGYYKKGETRFQFYFAQTKRSGDGLRKFFNANKSKIYLPGIDMKAHLDYYTPIIKWKPNYINSVKDKDKYNLVSINFKIPTTHMRLGGLDQTPYLNEVGETFDPTYDAICLNTETAKERKLAEGDMVTVESAHGKVTGKLHVTELIMPKVVGIAGALGRLVNTLGPKAHKRVFYNKLTGAGLSERDPISMGVVNNCPVRIYKA
jgi:anaerobic selenocysteine-containing dehydrogenase